MALSRRTFLYIPPLALAPLLPQCAGGDEPANAASPFLHGVASGDPLPEAVVIWTRISVDGGGTGRVAVDWWVTTDAQLQEVVAQGVAATDENVDFTVKVDVGGLEPGRTYFYRFAALGFESPIGRTRTAPDGGVARLRFALASCANYPYGFFNAYAAIARRPDLDAVLHLGDYLYEYAEGDYGTGAPLGRAPNPLGEMVTLADYRARHAQYKTDPDLQEAHRQHPFITIWDDHEVANDAWRDGAQNHQPDEGDFAARKAAGIRAYFEWMPIRAEVRAEDGQVYRSFRFGDLVDLIMLDTRLVGRDPQVADACDTAGIEAPERQLLGAEQETWFFGELTRSQQRGARWRIVGQQVMVGQLVNVLDPAACIFSPDQWDGYGAARARVLSTLAENAIENVVVLTGDIHSSWGNELTQNPFDPAGYDPTTGAGSLAVEIVTPSVTSPGIEDQQLAAQLIAALGMTHPHVKYVNLDRHGYALLDVTPERVQAEWYHMGTVAERRTDEVLAATLQVFSGSNHLVPALDASTPPSDPPELAPTVGESTGA